MLVFILMLAGIASRIFIAPAIERTAREKINQIDLPGDWELSVNNVTSQGLTTILMEGVNLSSIEERKEISAQRIKLSAKLTDFLKEKTLKVDVHLYSAEYENINADLFLSVFSKHLERYRDILDLSSLKKIRINDAKLVYEDHLLDRLKGDIFLDNMIFTEANIEFVLLGQKASVNAKMVDKEKKVYLCKALYPGISIETSFFLKDTGVRFKDIESEIFGIKSFFTGKLLISPGENLRGEFKGDITADLKDLVLLPVDTEFFKDQKLKGLLRTGINISFSEPSLEKMIAEADTLITDIEYEGIHVESFEIKSHFKEGILHIPGINGKIYQGSLTGAFTADLLSEEYTFSSSLKLINFDLEKIVNDLIKKRTHVRGKIDGELSLSGQMKTLSTINGNGKLHAYEANLGPMPILAPLVGNLYVLIERSLPVSDDLNINEGRATFEISDEQISTNDLTLSGKYVIIEGTGSVGFDGKLDIHFRNRLITPKEIDHADTVQQALRGAIISLGQMLSKAHLRGSLQEPNWEFEYLPHISDTIGRGLRMLLDVL